MTTVRLSSIFVVATGVLVIVALVVIIAVFVVVGRRGGQQRRNEVGPLAAPGMTSNRATASRLLLELTDARPSHLTELEFARLQLPAEVVTGYERAIAEADAAADELSRAVSRTRDSDGRGPTGTQEAGVLAAAMRRAEEAARRLDVHAGDIAERRRPLPPARGDHAPS